MQRCCHIMARLSVLLCVAIVSIPNVSYAELNVSGTVADIRVVANNKVPISSVLSAVAAICRSRYRSSVPLDEIVSGAYSGPLEAWMPRLLNDYDYFIKRDGISIEIVVIGGRGPKGIAPHSPPVAPPIATSTIPAASSHIAGTNDADHERHPMFDH
jgi:hypothetical protein